MKRQILTTGAALLLLASACKKNDLEMQAQNVPAANAWTAATAWSSAKEDAYTSYSTSIQDKRITADVIDNGLVLVYLKNGRNINSLPYQQKNDVNADWHYQVSENTIEISADVYSANVQPDGNQQFTYFVLSAGKLKSLEEAGHDLSEIMTLSYEKAKSLLQ